MAIVDIENVKAKFEAGDSPRSSDYIDMIDTLAAMPDISGKQDTASAVSNAGGSTITASGATVKPLVLKGFASQTANLQEWQNSSGTVLAKIDASGNATLANVTLGLLTSGSDYRGSYGIGGGGLTTYHGAFAMQSWSTTIVTGVLRAAASQTANLQEWQDSAGTVLAKIMSNGSLFVNSTGTSNDPITIQRASATRFKVDPYGNVFAGALTAGSVVTSIAGTTAGIYTSSASGIGLIIRGAASQTANLQEWQNSAGTVLASVNSLGNIIGNNIVTSNGVAGSYGLFTAGASAVTPITAKGASGQTANLTEWQNSAGTVLSVIDTAGNFTKGDGDQLVLAGQIFG